MNLNSVTRLCAPLPGEGERKTRTDEVPAKVTLSISRPSSEITGSYVGVRGRPPTDPLATDLAVRDERRTALDAGGGARPQLCAAPGPVGNLPWTWQVNNVVTILWKPPFKLVKPTHCFSSLVSKHAAYLALL